MKIVDDFGGRVKMQESLARHTTLGVGGPARFFFEPETPDEAVGIVRRFRGEGTPLYVLGGGANLLVRDAGVDGAVLSTRLLNRMERHPWGIRAQAGVNLPKLVQWAAQAGLGGLEPLVGVPGTVGGATFMNAGGRYGSVERCITNVRYLDSKGEVRDAARSEIPFAYRRSGLKDCLVLSAELGLDPEDPAKLTARVHEIYREKAGSQPLKLRSAGCIFKNPPGRSAGKLLEEAGLKGRTVNRARISERHANFIVNLGGAAHADVCELIRIAREIVQEKFGVWLELEVVEWP